MIIIISQGPTWRRQITSFVKPAVQNSKKDKEKQQILKTRSWNKYLTLFLKQWAERLIDW